MDFFSLHKTTVFGNDLYKGSIKFYRDTIQILWLLPSAHSGNKWW